jgi:hypothetical protein
MNKRGTYGPMSERVARSRNEDPVPAAPELPSIRHCWVTTSAGRLPGLLLEWRRRPEWEGRVVHAVRDDQGWAIVEEWLPAGLLDPVSSGG